jgi:serine/threonine-protein kinase
MASTQDRWQRIEELYHSALELDPSARAAFLDDACGPDEDLRREVESLLAESPTGQALLDRPMVALFAESGTIELKLGARLGPYQIEALIGLGGMGKVYRASDTRFGRTVAIKTSNARFNERFEREARAVAALNHPNICTLYDAGPNYLVLEFVEGETLSRPINQGPLPLDETLRIAGQIAAALAAAHEKGIVHRDLKPANVKITPGGLVKVLDFGLAKRISQRSADGSMTTGLTEVGTAVGTPAYMAPEQAQGKEVDKCADVWAFGVLLYELLSGQRPFRGDSLQATLAAVLTKEPDLAIVPARVRPLLRACLKKDPQERLSNIGDWRLLLGEDDHTGPAATVANPWARSVPWLVAATAVLLAGVAAWAPWRHDPTKQIGEPLVRIDADLGTGVSLFTENGPALALSHDGARVAFSSRGADGNMRLLWRRLDQVTATILPGTESAFSPFFSPDGEQIAFFAEGSLKKVDLATGNVTVLANAVNPAGGTWGDDGVIVFNRAPTLDLWTIPANGGDMKQLPRDANVRLGRYWPQLLPGGKALLVTRALGPNNMGQYSVESVSLADGRSRTLVEGAHFGRYLSSGHLAYLRRGTLFVRGFDAARLTLSGPEVPILQGVEYSTVDGAGQFDLAANGTLIYRAARAGSELKTVQLMDRTGRLEPLVGTPGDYRAISFSRDGKRLAMTIADGGVSDLYVYDVERRQPPARLTVGANIAPGWGLAWSADGRYLFFSVSGSTWWVPAEGLSQPREFIRNYVVSKISRDGTRMFAATFTPKTRGDAGIVPLSLGRDGPQAGRPVPLLHEIFSEAPFEDSLDGKWLSYATDETGIAQTYVTEVANPTRKWIVSSVSGQSAFWSPSEPEIFFATFFAPLRIMVTHYSLEGGTFHPDQPRQWSPVAIPSHASTGATNITMAPDGKRFAVLMPAEQPLGNRVTFVMNFSDEVRRRIAAAK